MTTLSSDTESLDHSTPSGCPLGYPPPPRPGLEPIVTGLGLGVANPVRVQLPTGEHAWLVTDFAQVQQVMSDRRFSRAEAARDNGARFAGVAPPAGSLLALDPPDHTRLRALVNGAFTRRRVDSLREPISDIVDQLVAALAEQPDDEPVDLVTEFCLPLPIKVICRLLGVPEADADRFRNWSAAFLSSSSADRAEIGRAAGQLAAYLGELAGRRTRDPQDDLISALVRAEGITTHEVVSLCIAVLVAGYETTSAELTNALWLILEEPGRAAWLRADPSRIPAAVDEVLRWVSLGAGGGFPRVVLEDIELGGVSLRAGDAVVPAIDAANRDPKMFTEPDLLRWDRDPATSLAFGYGLHYCLGAQLARIELQIALERLLIALPGLQLAYGSAKAQWRQGNLVRTLVQLPVVY